MVKQVSKPTHAEILDTDQYSKINEIAKIKEFTSQWDGYTDPILHTNKSELSQIAELLEAHMAKVFGVDFYVGFFTELDLSNRQSGGYVVLPVSKFPRGDDGKPTWSKAIALSMKLHNDTEGNIRWGNRGELIACVIPKHIRERNQKQVRKEADDVMTRHMGQRGKSEQKDADGHELTSHERTESRERIAKPIRKN
jgi:hypothetical protein